MVHNIERLAVGVITLQRLHAQDQMHLLGVVLHDLARACSCSATASHGAIARREPTECCFYLAQRFVVIERTSDCHHRRTSAVMRVEEVAHIVGSYRLDGVWRASGFATEGMVGKQVTHESAVCYIVGAVVVHREFFENHLTFVGDVVVTQCR